MYPYENTLIQEEPDTVGNIVDECFQVATVHPTASRQPPNFQLQLHLMKLFPTNSQESQHHYNRL